MSSKNTSLPLITLVAGARPNFMKIAPIIRALEQHPRRVRYELVHTGQHYDHAMSDVFFEELGIPAPDLHLDAGGGSHATQTAKVMTGFERYCETSMPQLVLVVGDVNSTLACTIVAKKLQLQVAHVEAGLRSRDREMPEEINRLVTDAISDYFFVTEPDGAENLKNEGQPSERVHFVGHVMIDNLFHQLAKLQLMDEKTLKFSSLKDSLGEYGVVTLHRPSNVDHEPTLRRILAALEEIADRLPLVFSVHPRTADNIKKFGIQISDRISILTSLPYMEFLNLWKDARLILTDSGGLQEESTALGVPCLTVRENTERPITVSGGTNTLVGTDAHLIRSTAFNILDRKLKHDGRRPELWDGNAATRIVDILLTDMEIDTSSRSTYENGTK